MHPEQLLRTVDALRDAAAGIEAELERPDAEVRRLGGRWWGEAREAYSRAQVQGDLVDTARTGFTRTWANRDKFATVQRRRLPGGGCGASGAEALVTARLVRPGVARSTARTTRRRPSAARRCGATTC